MIVLELDVGGGEFVGYGAAGECEEAGDVWRREARGWKGRVEAMRWWSSGGAA